MANIILTKESSEDIIKSYFNAILKLSQSDNKFPINLDEVWMLVYSEKGKAVRALEESFLEGVDYEVFAQNGKNPKGGRPTNEYKLSVSCLEYFIARKVRPVFEIYRQVFHKVATNQRVLSPKELALMVIQAEEEKERLALENKAQQERIEELEEQTVYTRMVLNSPSTVLVTQIAQDYGMSAIKFNATLRDLGIQRKVGAQWILYGKHIDKGYVQSHTTDFTHKDGSKDVTLTTKWTQKGRLFLYNELKKNGILPLIELYQLNQEGGLYAR